MDYLANRSCLVQRDWSWIDYHVGYKLPPHLRMCCVQSPPPVVLHLSLVDRQLHWMLLSYWASAHARYSSRGFAIAANDFHSGSHFELVRAECIQLRERLQHMSGVSGIVESPVLGGPVVEICLPSKLLAHWPGPRGLIQHLLHQ